MKQNKGIVYNRQQRIIDYMKENEEIKVNELSRVLNVSEITIRRDLETLEKKGIIERYHGGARLNVPGESDMDFEEKGLKNSSQKELIAKAAAALIREGDILFLNSGSTVSLVLKYLLDKHAKVITNNAVAPAFLPENTNVELIMTGGEYRERSKSLVGDVASGIINKVCVNKCILGVNGISYERGLTTSVYQETIINEMMVNNCQGEIIIVADGSKVGRSYSFISIGIEQVSTLITDRSADPKELEKFEKAGINVIVVDQD